MHEGRSFFARMRVDTRPFRHRDFSVFWTGSFLSSMGTQFTTVAMAWQIYELTNSALQIGLLGFRGQAGTRAAALDVDDNRG